MKSLSKEPTKLYLLFETSPYNDDVLEVYTSKEKAEKRLKELVAKVTPYQYHLVEKELKE